MKNIHQFVFTVLMLSSTLAFAQEKSFKGKLTGGGLPGFYMINDKEVDANDPSATNQFEALITNGKTDCVIAKGTGILLLIGTI